MKALKAFAILMVSVIATVLLLTSFTDNLQTATGEPTRPANYTWDDFEASTGISVENISLENFKAALGIQPKSQNINRPTNHPMNQPDQLANITANETETDIFTPSIQEEIEPYSDGKSMQELIAEFCGMYGTPEYEQMQQSLSDANPGKDFSFFFGLMDVIAPFCH